MTEQKGPQARVFENRTNSKFQAGAKETFGYDIYGFRCVRKCVESVGG